MAQDFESNGAQITNSATTIFTSNSDDAVVGLRLANILTTTVTVSIFVSEGGSTTRYLVKDLSIPPASSVELVQGGAKFVLQSGDVLKGQAGTADSIAPAGETIHEHDTEINKDQIITSAVFAGPITFAATVTVTGTVVVV